MKTFKIFILSTLFLSVIFSCNDDVLNLIPSTKIAADEVFQNEDFAKAYVTNLYARLWYDDFSTTLPTIGDEATLGDGSRRSLTGGEDHWNYSLIRDMNVFIENIKDSPLQATVKSQLEGEVRVLRAYIYFQMEIRWGGVPLVDVVIDPYGEIDEMYGRRSSEEAIADFIDTELAVSAEMLTTNPKPQGRINKWTALALKARTNLWAASIAKHGTVQLNGLLGIPASRANEFFTKASDAANAVIQSGKYSLYNKLPGDKAENYRRIFVDEENSEVIFEKPYDGINIGHGYDTWNAPNSIAIRGGLINPILEFILGFENVDGSTDQPEFGVDHLYSDGREAFNKKDPRLFGSVFFQGDNWAGITLETYEGTDPSNPPNPGTILSNYLNIYQGRPEAGYESRSGLPAQQSTNSGFLIKKYIDESRTYIIEGQSSINWIIFRLAEMYLTIAEAQFELGNMQPAVDALNATRSRAGISLVDQNTISLDKVRTERHSELSFEGIRYWDLRRWRVAESVLSGWMHGLRIIYHAPSDKYYFLEMQAETSTRDFESKHYYNAITQSRINNNPLLIENPGYN